LFFTPPLLFAWKARSAAEGWGRECNPKGGGGENLGSE
jgi:hypothetical protein